MAEQGQDSRIRPAGRKALPKARQDSPAASPQQSANGATSNSATSNGASPKGHAKAASQATRSIRLPEDEQGGLTQAIRSLFRATPSWLTSMVVHVVVLLILCVLTPPGPAADEMSKLISSVASTEVAPVQDLTSTMLEPGSPTGSLDSTSTTEALFSNEMATVSNSISSPFNDP